MMKSWCLFFILTCTLFFILYCYLGIRDIKSTMSAPKGLTWPKFRSWYSKNIGDSDVSIAWNDYKNNKGSLTKNGGVGKGSTKKKSAVNKKINATSGRGDQDEWDQMGASLDMISAALKTNKKKVLGNKKTVVKSTPMKRGKVKSRTSPAKYTEEEKKKFFKKGSKLNEKQKDYCRCVLEVENVVNPWATCAKGIHTSYHDCGQEYDWYNLPSRALRNYARNSKIQINKNDTDDQVREKINKWKQNKYGER